MTSFTDDWAASRRVFVLRLLVEVKGEANESVIYKAALRGGFSRDTRDTIRQDLDRLRQAACVTEEWLGDSLRVVRITERGDDVAHGRIEVPGIECSRWDR